MADTDHARIVARIAATHEQRLLSVLQTLENRLADYMNSAPTKQGDLFDLAWSLRARADITQIVRETYLTEVDQFVREYDQVIDSLEDLYSEFGEFVGVDKNVISQLKNISFQGFQDIGSTFTDELANELYQNTLTGRPISQSVRTIRQKINGIYMNSDRAEINRLVAIAKQGGKAADDAIEALHKEYAADRTGRNMRRYARQMVHDSIMQFDASVNIAAAQRLGAEEYKYYGSVVEDSRDWCVRHVNQTYSEEEIRDMWAENEWAGKAPGDPFIVRGGYNCRHHFRPVFGLELD
jgi:hypothetical protein